MNLVAIAALIAVCGAAKLDRTYLPPPSAATAGGSSDSLQTPLTRSSEQDDTTGNLPTGSYTNSFQGVVVEAAGPGTRSSPDADQSGLGGPRETYGSQNSKVGDAAFRGSIVGFQSTPFGSSGFNGQGTGVNVEQNIGAFEAKSERPQASKDRSSNIISYANDVNIDNYSYGFESDNGISVGENGIANNGIQAQGGYSYKGDDGQVYKVTYVADEGGYRPQGDHLPTPPPIPKEILLSLEKNAKDEAAGLIDDGSYDAQKYNAEGDYMHQNGGNIQYNDDAQMTQFARRPESDATASNTFINQNSQAFDRNYQFRNNEGNNKPNQFVSSSSANNLNVFSGSQPQVFSHTLNGPQKSSSADQISGQFGESSGSQLNQDTSGNQNSLVGQQNDRQAQVTQFGASPSQTLSQTSFTFQSNSELGSAPLLETQPNIVSYASRSQQNQLNNQVFKPQSSFGAAEYLPPFNTNKKPSYNNPQTNEVSKSKGSNKDSQSVEGSNQSSSTSSFASMSSASFQPQIDTQTFNGLANQPSKPINFNLNNGQSESNDLTSAFQYSGFNKASRVKPTSVPSIELTTPLEPNETSTFSKDSHTYRQSNPSFGSFSTQSPSKAIQSQTGFQDSVNAAQQQTSQTLSPSFMGSRPQDISQYGSASQAIGALSNTQKPGFEKPSFSQGFDDSYYYKQPSKPFDIPVAHPQRPSFSNMPSYQSNGVVPSQNYEFSNQQATQSIFNNLPTIPQPTSIAPTPSQITQTQSGISTNRYNGITQASISSFSSVAPTTSSQYGNTQTDRFDSSFSAKPVTTTTGQNPSTFSLLSQSQIQQSSLSNTNLPSVSQPFPSKRTNTFGQSSFTGSQSQFGISSINNDNDKPLNSETNQKQDDVSIQTQQYEGTVYEYNKPPEVLPATKQPDSSSSQTVQANFSTKPEDSQVSKYQQTQSGQSAFSPQPSNLNQGSKPQMGSQMLKPQSGQNLFGRNTQSTISQQNIQGQGAVLPIKPNEPTGSSTSAQFSQIQQTGFVPKPQFGSQPTKNSGNSISSSQVGQNVRQQMTQNGMQLFKPLGEAQTTSQIGQFMQSNFGRITQQNSGSQFLPQVNKPFGSTTGFSQFGQVVKNQNSQYGQQYKTPETIQNSGTQNFQGYPSSKPQIGNQLNLPQFSQSSTQITEKSQTDVVPSKYFENESTKPQFGQNFQRNQATQSSGTFGQQQSYQTPQISTTASKLQFGAQPQFGQNQNLALKPFNSAISQAQFGSNSVQASSSAFSQPSNIQAYKPYGALSGSKFSSQNKSQFDQASQSVSTTSPLSQLGTQSFGTITQGSQTQLQSVQPRPPCCKSFNKDSAIGPLNVGKPSQAFAQAQSQFTGFKETQLNAQNIAGKGEDFSGPRQPPSFDPQTGYHY